MDSLNDDIIKIDDIELIEFPEIELVEMEIDVLDFPDVLDMSKENEK